MTNSVVCEEVSKGLTVVAKVNGQPVVELPDNLYIPPQALEVVLEAFEGPLDLLLYLIKRNNLDILDIPIAEITRQYIEYIQTMDKLEINLAADYLVMAAMLAEIKSRMLVPKSSQDEDIDEDPRAELVRRLQEYEAFKEVVEKIEALPQLGRDVLPVQVQQHQAEDLPKPLPVVELDQLVRAFKSVLQRAELQREHFVPREALSMRDRMSRVLGLLKEKKSVYFHELFSFDEGRVGLIVTFVALLELMREALIEIVQISLEDEIQVREVV